MPTEGAGFKRCFVLTLGAIVTFGLAVTAVPAYAKSALPLLMQGKNTLFQKVLTRPGARVLSKPDPSLAGSVALVAPFSVYYVYGRSTIAGADWVEIGASQLGKIDGWIKASNVIEWKQTLTVAFTNPGGRDRVLFFRDRDTLVELLESEMFLFQAEQMREGIARGELGPNFPLAIEPENHIDINEQFYILPILEAEEVYISSGFPMTLLKVASVTLKEDKPLTEPSAPPPAKPPTKPNKAYSAAVVFVIDSTISMGPYIDRTRAVVQQIFKKIEAAALVDKVRFGLIAYRDNVNAVPGLEYLTRWYANPVRTKSGRGFFKLVEALEPANIASKGFVEDAYAGVITALEQVNWDEFGGRYIVIITDAGARDSNDPLSSTGLSAEQVRLIAKDKGVVIYVLHLLTDYGQFNHESAREQYQALSLHTDSATSLYFPVTVGNVERFGEAVNTLTNVLLRQVARGADPAAQRAAISAGQAAMKQAQGEEEKKLLELELKTEIVGLAMQLAYLGRQEGTQAQSFFEAWVADRDFRRPDVPSLEVRVLLTKNQLSDLQEVLKRIIEAGKLGQLSPDDFFDQLRSAAAAMGRDPSRVSRARSIAELGLMGEYLEDLPYKSKIMNVDQDLWLSWGIGQQQQFLDEIEAKIRLYRKYHDDTDRWKRLARGASSGDAIYPVPLEALP